MSTNLDGIIRQLEEERNRIDRAIQALIEVRSGTFPRKVRKSPATRGKMAAARPRRTMSAAARRKIAAAQRARWARLRAQKKA